jgi:hypothetical protein
MEARAHRRDGWRCAVVTGRKLHHRRRGIDSHDGVAQCPQLPAYSALPTRDVQRAAAWRRKHAQQGRRIYFVVRMVMARSASELHPVLCLGLPALPHRHVRKPATADQLSHDPDTVLHGH